MEQVAENHRNHDRLQAEAAESDGYASGNEPIVIAADSSFSSLDDEAPPPIYLFDDSDGDFPWDDEEDLIVSSDGPHYCIECHPWENEESRVYLRGLFKRRNVMIKQRTTNALKIAELRDELPSSPYEQRKKKLLLIRVLKMRQAKLRMQFRKVNGDIQREAHQYLIRMNSVF